MRKYTIRNVGIITIIALMLIVIINRDIISKLSGMYSTAKRSDWTNGKIVCILDNRPCIISIGQTIDCNKMWRLNNKNDMEGQTRGGIDNLPTTKSDIEIYRDKQEQVLYYLSSGKIVGVYGYADRVIATTLCQDNVIDKLVVQPGDRFSLPFNDRLTYLIKNPMFNTIREVDILQYYPGGIERYKPYTRLLDDYHVIYTSDKYVLYIGISDEKRSNTIRSIGIFDRQYVNYIPLSRAIKRNTIQRIKIRLY